MLESYCCLVRCFPIHTHGPCVVGASLGNVFWFGFVVNQNINAGTRPWTDAMVRKTMKSFSPTKFMFFNFSFSFEVQIKPETWKKTSSQSFPEAASPLRPQQDHKLFARGWCTLSCFFTDAQQSLTSTSNPKSRWSLSAQSFICTALIMTSLFPWASSSIQVIISRVIFSEDEFWWDPSALTSRCIMDLLWSVLSDFLTLLENSHKENNHSRVNKHCHTLHNKFTIWIPSRLRSKDHMYFFFKHFIWQVFLEDQGSVVGFGADWTRPLATLRRLQAFFKALWENSKQNSFKLGWRYFIKTFFPLEEKCNHTRLLSFYHSQIERKVIHLMFTPLSRPACSLPFIFNISPKNIPGRVLDAGGISEMLLCCKPKC